MSIVRSLAVASAAALLLPLSATMASAATAPANDTVGGATTLSSLPTHLTLDTTAATTDATDAAANSICGAPHTNASVWFTYTDATGAGIVADMSASDYSGGFIITDGVPAADGSNLLSCGPGVAAARAAAGTTYYIVAFSDTSTNGGNLDVTFSEAPPAPQASLTVNPKGTAYKDGSARLTGTYTCLNADGWSSGIEGTLTQRVGRTKINGYFFVSPLVCDGTTQPWEGWAVSDTGLFAGGKAANVSIAWACGLLDCTTAEANATVQLSKGSGK